MNHEIKSLIEKTVQEMFQKMGFSVSVTTRDDEITEESSGIICEVKVNGDSNILIGQYGINLQSLQHIARLLVRKKTEEKVNFVVDINSYRLEKNRSILDLAVQAAEQAVQEKRAVALRPMSSYERRLVHMELSKNDTVTTESVGEGENRKIVVKPAENF